MSQWRLLPGMTLADGMIPSIISSIEMLANGLNGIYLGAIELKSRVLNPLTTVQRSMTGGNNFGQT
ncbi:hypothetical protein [Leptothoe kymatousa]|uniref:Uncharacterized protein n=1 Tax=Leptothoe kymatousa TAU-MAC 1615 TaxID=2364775 RepID=A0ABS5Y2G3_9CYAN|nr:hypothetical protein [Leptothoe kymatousa]MBT9311698.1 hypothetical protein [Leptothoe kymatousa TAU-MAC 1615]